MPQYAALEYSLLDTTIALWPHSLVESLANLRRVVNGKLAKVCLMLLLALTPGTDLLCNPVLVLEEA